MILVYPGMGGRRLSIKHPVHGVNLGKCVYFVILDPEEEIVVAFHDGIQLSSLASQTLA